MRPEVQQEAPRFREQSQDNNIYVRAANNKSNNSNNKSNHRNHNNNGPRPLPPFALCGQAARPKGGVSQCWPHI
ncbi:TSET complex member tstF-like [Drosophila navojoa]|uniref:TSET complex member tstF-like n=1 Tax=Drosophila navojoa TaxID=7232 RepID=UPI0011BE62B4|nr:TSET complex member tstF-like [Drosophila navojoa]